MLVLQIPPFLDLPTECKTGWALRSLPALGKKMLQLLARENSCSSHMHDAVLNMLSMKDTFFLKSCWTLFLRQGIYGLRYSAE